MILPDTMRFRAAIARKATLKAIYREFYGYYRDCLQRCPEAGAVVEIGAGGGFASEMVPQLIATDLIPYPTVDIVLDATQLPFPSRSVRCFLMLNTFHHIADCGRFLEEAARCLVSGGRILDHRPAPRLHQCSDPEAFSPRTL